METNSNETAAKWTGVGFDFTDEIITKIANRRFPGAGRFAGVARASRP
jgi:hypothetical protein